MKKLTLESFVEKAKLIHKNKYDYSISEYKNTITKISIICPIHGEFYQRANNHLSGIGCVKCRSDKLKNLFKLDKEKFIVNSDLLFKNFYDYSLVEYVNTHTKVKIICPIHGEFEQSPANHYRYGCRKCSMLSSKGENIIEEWLKEHKIEYVSQKYFSDCKNKRSLPFDFYLPTHNICIEYDGEHHFFVVHRSKDEEMNIKEFEKIKVHDKIKDEYCKNNNIRLIRIPYLKLKEITNIMETILV